LASASEPTDQQSFFYFGLGLAWSDPVNNSITSTSIWIRIGFKTVQIRRTVQVNGSPDQPHLQLIQGSNCLSIGPKDN
jgi:hypothetical protein